MIAFIQPFGTNSPGGGARILRALFAAPHPPVRVVNTAIGLEAGSGDGEILLPLRKGFGRLEYSRFNRYFGHIDGLYASSFKRRLAEAIHKDAIEAVHLIPHSYEFVPAYELTRERNLPLFLSIHDDYRCPMPGHPRIKQMERAVGEAWNRALRVFVIGEEIGQEFSSRFGRREYQIVTDGLTNIADRPQDRPANSLRLYFMGLFHYNYRDNLHAVLRALRLVREDHPDWRISVTLRGGTIPIRIDAEDVPVSMRPWGSEEEIERDMQEADLLYQPMPFQPESANFSLYSLSTKMITYLGSGLPIFYHGPEHAAARQLLARHDAALTCASLSPGQIARELVSAMARREEIVENALALARSRFVLADQQARFWGNICDSLASVQRPTRIRP